MKLKKDEFYRLCCGLFDGRLREHQRASFFELLAGAQKPKSKKSCPSPRAAAKAGEMTELSDAPDGIIGRFCCCRAALALGANVTISRGPRPQSASQAIRAAGEEPRRAADSYT